MNNLIPPQNFFVISAVGRIEYLSHIGVTPHVVIDNTIPINLNYLKAFLQQNFPEAFNTARKRIPVAHRYAIIHTLMLFKNKYGLTLNEIGSIFPKVDHSNVIYANKKVNLWLQTKVGYDEEIDIVHLIRPKIISYLDNLS